MADDPRAALASLEHQLRELAAELVGGAAPVEPRPPTVLVAPEPVAAVAAEPEPPTPRALSLVPPPTVLSAAERVAAAAVEPPAPDAEQPEEAPTAAASHAAVTAGPFDAADPVLAFRDALAALPGVRGALLRRVEDGTAHIEVELS